jgi:hypothetical protein
LGVGVGGIVTVGVGGIVGVGGAVGLGHHRAEDGQQAGCVFGCSDRQLGAFTAQQGYARAQWAPSAGGRRVFGHRFVVGSRLSSGANSIVGGASSVTGSADSLATAASSLAGGGSSVAGGADSVALRVDTPGVRGVGWRGRGRGGSLAFFAGLRIGWVGISRVGTS